MNSDTLKVVTERIRKLLALGTSSNEHEAALAVAKAQELLHQYDLSMESVENLKSDPRTSVGKRTSGVETRDGKPEGWKADLLTAVAGTSDCAVLTTYSSETTRSGRRRTVKHYHVVGFLHDVEMVGYSTSFLIQEVERLAQFYANKMWAEIRAIESEEGLTHQQAESAYVHRTGRHPLKAKLYFIRGATERLVTDLWRQRRERTVRLEDGSSNPYAMTVNKKAAVDDFVSVEQYGMTVAERKAKVEEQRKRYEAEVAKNPPPPEKPETPAQRRKREEREQREWQRWRDRQYREEMRREAATDHQAMSDGHAAGSVIQMRRGLKAGSETSHLPGE